MPVTEELHGQRFTTRIDGRLTATPLLAALVVVELTDIVFAIDSVPAILAVSTEPFLVFASNAFAILGLRAMYFLLANAKQRFHYLSHALGAILNTYLSLLIITIILTAATMMSVRRSRRAAEISNVDPARTPDR
jgi:tellurite resistance protein TerC